MFELIEHIIRKKGYYFISKNTLEYYHHYSRYAEWSRFLDKGFKVVPCKLEEHFLIKSIR